MLLGIQPADDGTISSIQKVLRWKENGQRLPLEEISGKGPEVKIVWAQWDILEIKDEKLGEYYVVQKNVTIGAAEGKK